MSTLSEEEKDTAIQLFKDFTGSNDSFSNDECADILNSHGWNVQNAVNAYIGIGGSESNSPSSGLRRRRRADPMTEQPSISSTATATATTGRDTRNATNPTLTFLWIIQMLCCPVSWLFRVLRTPENETNDDDNGFQQVLEDTCQGARVPQIMQCNYKTAVARSHSESSKFLLLYLHSPLHQDTQVFCQTILGSELMCDFIIERGVNFWGASVDTAEGYSLSLELGAGGFPFLALLLTNSRNSVNVVWKTDCLLSSVERYVAHLSHVMNANQHVLINTQNARVARETTQLLRQEQDRAYQEALEHDRARAAAVVMEEAQAKAEAKAEAQARECKRLEMNQLLETFKTNEPGGSIDLDMTHLRFQLADGSRFERVFRREDSLSYVRDYVRVKLYERDISIARFEIATNFPRRAWGPNETQENIMMTLKEAELVPRAVLYVQDLDS